jgi:hypothetical protein
VLEVADAAVARGLTSGGLSEFLQPFVYRDASVAEAARALEQPIQRVHYRVQRLVEFGLLQVTAVEERAGRPVKRYRASANAYRIPARLVPEQLFPLTEAEHSAFMQRALEASLPALVHDGEIRITFSPDGSVNVDRFLGEGLEGLLGDAAPAVLNTWRNLHLDRARAKRLQRELWELIARYADPVEGGRRYVLRVSMAPVER